MNNYPYPVLTEWDSAYKDDCNFTLAYQDHQCVDNVLKVHLSITLNSKSLCSYVENNEAEIIVKLMTNIKTLVFHLDKTSKDITVEIPTENVASIDTIKIQAFIVTKKEMLFTANDEILDIFDSSYSIMLKENDILAVSNVEALNYTTISNDYIKIVSSEEQEGNGLKIRLTKENYIEIVVGKSFKLAYGKMNNDEFKFAVSSHLVFEAIFYALSEIAQNKDDFKDKTWFYQLSQALQSLDIPMDTYIANAYDNSQLDLEYIMETAQALISNTLEISMINIGNMEED